MTNETLLYVCGIILAVSAVGVSFIGLKVKDFPGKAMPLVVIWFAIFVGGSATFAVLHAKDEEADKAKEAKYEEANEKAEEDAGNLGENSSGGPVEEGEEAGSEEGESGEGHSEEGTEEAGAEESPEAAEEGAEEGGEMEGGGAGGEEASGGDPEAGSEVFATNCSVCHGEDGHGGAGGPDLTTMPKAQNEPEAIEQVTNGGGGMPAFGEQLSEEEIENVAAFVVQKVVGNG